VAGHEHKRRGYAQPLRHRLEGIGIEEVLTAPLDTDAPDSRPIELPATGRIVLISEVGGLHHRYIRQAA
jgi:hypothetical protein